jgi:hypothetical protein
MTRVTLAVAMVLAACAEEDAHVVTPTELPPYVSDVAYGNGRFLALQYEAGYLTAPPLIVKTSFDGDTWTAASQFDDSLDEPTQRMRVAASDDQFMLLGLQGPLLSADGATWSLAYDPAVAPPWGDGWLLDVVHGADQFVVVTNDGHAYRYDGAGWLAPDGAIPEVFGARLAYLDGRYFIYGSGPVLESSDAIHWIAHSLPTTAVLSMAVIDGEVVGYGLAMCCEHGGGTTSYELHFPLDSEPVATERAREDASWVFLLDAGERIIGIATPPRLATSTDGGATWVDVELPDLDELGALASDGADTVVAGFTQLVVSHDAGATWAGASGRAP